MVLRKLPATSDNVVRGFHTFATISFALNGDGGRELLQKF